MDVVPTVSSAGCFTIETGTIIIGSYCVLRGMLGGIVYTYESVFMHISWFTGDRVTLAAMDTIYAILSVFLMVGVARRNHKLMIPWLCVVPGLRTANAAEGIGIIILGGLRQSNHALVDECKHKPANCFYGPYVHGAFLILGAFVTFGCFIVVSSYYKLLRTKVLVASIEDLGRSKPK